MLSDILQFVDDNSSLKLTNSPVTMLCDKLQFVDDSSSFELTNSPVTMLCDNLQFVDDSSSVNDDCSLLSSGGDDSDEMAAVATGSVRFLHLHACVLSQELDPPRPARRRHHRGFWRGGPARGRPALRLRVRYQPALSRGRTRRQVRRPESQCVFWCVPK